MWHSFEETPDNYEQGRYILMLCFCGIGCENSYEITQVYKFKEDSKYCIEWAYCDELSEVH